MRTFATRTLMVTAWTVGILLLCSLVPSMAHAAENGCTPSRSGSALRAEVLSASSLNAQASSKGKVKMKVVTSIGKMKYHYNANGLLTQVIRPYTKTTYRYAGKRLKSYTDMQTIYSSPEQAMTTKLHYDKKGRIVKSVGSKKSSSISYIRLYSYDKKGRASKVVYTDSNNGSKLVRTYTYDRKGRVVKEVQKDVTANLRNDLSRIKYNKKGLVACEITNGPTIKYQYTFNAAGQIASMKNNESYGWRKYKYKTISIPKGYAGLVRQQQHILVQYPEGRQRYQ